MAKRLAPRIWADVVAGDRLWQQLQRWAPMRDLSPVADVVLELFGPMSASGVASMAESIMDHATLPAEN